MGALLVIAGVISYQYAETFVFDPLRVMSQIVVGIGFLGAGIIVRQGLHVRSLTTAATVWFVAAVGVLAGIGLLQFATIATVGLVVLLFILRKIDLPYIGPDEENSTRKRI